MTIEHAYPADWIATHHGCPNRNECPIPAYGFDEADRCAVEGVDHPVTHQSKVTAHYKEYSDNLLMFRLKALAPEKYRDNQKVGVHVEGADDFFRAIQEAKAKSE